jgi:hypothetical protein
MEDGKKVAQAWENRGRPGRLTGFPGPSRTEPKKRQTPGGSPEGELDGATKHSIRMVKLRTPAVVTGAVVYDRNALPGR